MESVHKWSKILFVLVQSRGLKRYNRSRLKIDSRKNEDHAFELLWSRFLRRCSSLYTGATAAKYWLLPGLNSLNHPRG